MNIGIKRSVLKAQEIRGVFLVQSDKPTAGRGGRHGMADRLSPAEQAQAIVDEAEGRAAAIVSQAEHSAEAIRSAAREAGYDDARQALEAERAGYASRIVEIGRDVAQQVEESWNLLEADVLSLSVEIARRILHAEISMNPDIVLKMIKEGLVQIRDRQELKVHVNPEDFELVRGRKEEISGACDGLRVLEIVKDRRVDQGSCIIETSNGHLDARIETQLAEVDRLLAEEVHGQRPVDGVGKVDEVDEDVRT